MGEIHTEVLVVGGGPAGLAAAIAVRMKGFTVTVVDAAHPPIDKACGEGILPAGVDALRRLGVDLEGGVAFRGIRFLGAGCVAEAAFAAGRPGMGIRRTRLHERMTRRAAEIGVRLCWGARRRPPSHWLVGADGLRSAVRNAAGLDARRSPSLRYGYRRHFRLPPWTDMVEVYWGRGCQIYVTPVSPGEVSIALLSRDPHLRLQPALAEFPRLVRRLAGAPGAGPERGAISASLRLEHVHRGCTFLVGDASGSVDAITGEGLTLAFHEALALAEALAAGNVERYETAHRQLTARAVMVERALLALDRLPRLGALALRGLANFPAVFRSILAASSPGSVETA